MKKKQRVCWEIWGPDLSPSQIRPSVERSGSGAGQKVKWAEWSGERGSKNSSGAWAERWAGLS